MSGELSPDFVVTVAIFFKDIVLKHCGIEIKSREAILVIVEAREDGLHFIDSKTRRIALADDDSQDSVKLFLTTMEAFLRNNQIQNLALKKRSKKGDFAGGPMTFKIEALLQINSVCPVQLLAGPTIAASNRLNNFALPAGLNKYQEEAYFTACCSALAK